MGRVISLHLFDHFHHLHGAILYSDDQIDFLPMYRVIADSSNSLEYFQITPCFFLEDVLVYICCPMKQHADIAQQVERILGKDEVPGSNPGISSYSLAEMQGFLLALGLIRSFAFFCPDFCPKPRLRIAANLVFSRGSGLCGLSRKLSSYISP